MALFCTKCGNKIEDGHRFCTSCGHPVPAANSTTKGNSGNNNAYYGNYNEYSGNNHSYQVNTISPKKKSPTLIIVPALLVLIIGVFAALYFLVLRPSQNRDDSSGKDKEYETAYNDPKEDKGDSETKDKDSEKSKSSKEESEKENDPLESQTSPDAFYSQLEGWVFTFSSGAGGWSTEMIINQYGEFEGAFHDSEMGDMGEDYPDGSMYFCEFSGTLDSPVQISEFVYKTTIKELNVPYPEEKEWIYDGIRYISSYPYGLEDARDIYIYLPGARVADLPEDYLNWVQYSIEDFNTGIQKEELDFYGFYNENAGNGFESYEYENIVDDAYYNPADDIENWVEYDSAKARGPEEEPAYDQGDLSLYGVIVTASDGYVNFRTGPGTDFDIISAIQNGEILAVYEEANKGKWLRVVYGTAQGWVAASEVTKQ